MGSKNVHFFAVVNVPNSSYKNLVVCSDKGKEKFDIYLNIA